uniref:Uncharacterized protein n=1 Tax=Arion vulgaris TaxID=1028688 RepID=A0A0B7A2S7_9EUPU
MFKHEHVCNVEVLCSPLTQREVHFLREAILFFFKGMPDLIAGEFEFLARV